MNSTKPTFTETSGHAITQTDRNLVTIETEDDIYYFFPGRTVRHDGKTFTVLAAEVLYGSFRRVLMVENLPDMES